MSVVDVFGKLLIAFSMYYDNVVSHSMSSLVMPFIFLGFFLKSIDIDAYKQLSE